MAKASVKLVVRKDDSYALILPKHDDPMHHFGKWFRVKHPESWGVKWAQAGYRVNTVDAGDVYFIWTWSSAPQGHPLDIFENRGVQI